MAKRKQDAARTDQVNSQYLDLTLEDLIAQLHQQAEIEKLFSKITHCIRRSLDLADIFNSCVTEIRSFLAVDRVILFKLFPDGSGVVVASAVAGDWKSLQNHIIFEPCFIDNWYEPYKNGRIQALSNVETANLTPCHLELLRNLQVKANLVIPIIQEKKLWGLLVAQNCQTAHDWPLAQIDLLQRLSEQIALSIDHAERYQQTQEIAQQQAAIAQLGQYALDVNDLLKVLDRAVTSITKLLKIEYCGILELLPNKASFSLKAGVGWSTDWVGKMVMHADPHYLGGYVLTQSHPVIIEDLRLENRFSGTPFLYNQRLISGVCITIGTPQQAYGILSVYSKKNRKFEQYEINFLQAIANLIATEYQHQTAREEEQFHKILLHSISDALITTDIQGKITFASPSVKQIFGYSSAEILDFGNIKNFLGHDSYNEKRLESQKEITNLEQQVIDHFGKTHYLLISIKRLSLRHGTILFSCRDISNQQAELFERQRIEKALSSSQIQYRNLIENLQAALVVHGPQTEIIYANDLAEQFLGLMAIEMAGKQADDPDWHFFRADGSKMPLEDFPVNKVMREKKTLVDYEVGVYQSLTRKMVWVLANAYPEFDEQGNILRVVVNFVDISDRKQSETILRNIAQGISRQTGEEFLGSLTAYFAETLQLDIVIIGKLIPPSELDANYQIETIAYLVEGKLSPNELLPIENSPFQDVLNDPVNLYSHAVQKTFPKNHFLKQLNAESYIGIQLMNSKGEVIGVLAGLNRHPMAEILIQQDILKIFAVRAAIELERRQILLDLQNLNHNLEFRVNQRTHALQVSENLFRTLVQTSGTIMIFLSPQYEILEWNSEAEKIFGYHRKNVLKQNFLDLFRHHFKRVEIRDKLKKVLKGKMLRNQEISIQDQQKNTYHVLWNANGLWDDNNLPLGIIFSGQNITYRKDIEEALRRSEEKFRVTFEQAAVGIIQLTLSGYFLQANPHFCKMLGYSTSELLEKSIFEIIHPDDREHSKEILLQILQNKEHSRSSEKRYIRADGEILWVSITKSLALNQVGKPEYVIAVLQDIRDRKQAEHQMQEALNKEKELHQLKNQFIDISSHEFRTPLTIILGSVDYIESRYQNLPDEKKKKYLHNIHDAGERLKMLIEEVLTISRLESGKVKPNYRPLNIHLFCQNLVEEMQLGMNNTIALNLDHCESQLVYADERLLQHIFSNLLSNALKYSPQGDPVEFSVYSDRQNHLLRFEIRDHGIGIPPEDQSHLFESFYRASNVGSIPGTGLGLNIVQQYVELHEGTITYHSQMGRGTTFTVMLPLRETVADFSTNIQA